MTSHSGGYAEAYKEQDSVFQNLHAVAVLAVEIFLNKNDGIKHNEVQRLADLVERDLEPLFNGQAPGENLAAIFSVFRKAADGIVPKDMALPVAIRAMALCQASGEIIRARSVIDEMSGMDAVKSLWSGHLIEQDWLKIELLQYAWNDGFYRCQDVIGFLLGMAYQAGEYGGLCHAAFGPDLTTEMFEHASSEGLEEASSAPSTALGDIVYRGGFSDDPAELAAGMSWTEDLAQAAWFASRRGDQIGQSMILSIKTRESGWLARSEHEMEVVLPFDPDRSFEVVAVGDAGCESYCSALFATPKNQNEP